LLSSPVDDTLW